MCSEKFFLGSVQWKKRKGKVQKFIIFHQSIESSLGGNPHFPFVEMTLLSCEYRNTKWQAALSCWFLFFICIVMPRCCLCLRKTSQVRQRYFNSTADLWMVAHWGEKDTSDPLKPPQLPIHLNRRLAGPFFSTSQSLDQFHCLHKPGNRRMPKLHLH